MGGIRFGIHADNNSKKTSDFRHESDCTTGCANLHSLGASPAPPGNSGLLGDPHCGDLLPLWLKGEYVPALWKREEVEREGVERVEVEG